MSQYIVPQILSTFLFWNCNGSLIEASDITNYSFQKVLVIKSTIIQANKICDTGNTIQYFIEFSPLGLFRSNYNNKMFTRAIQLSIYICVSTLLTRKGSHAENKASSGQ